MKNMYPHEKFSNAVRSMAVSPKSIQERVGEAYVFNLIHLKPEDLPDEIRYRFTEMTNKLTARTSIGDEGTVAATTRQMSTDEAIAIAQELLYMADAIDSAFRDE